MKQGCNHDFTVCLQYYAHAEAAIPLGRVGTCEDHIVPLIMFMVSDKATFINGAVIVADGGYSHTCNCPWMYSHSWCLTYFSVQINIICLSFTTICYFLLIPTSQASKHSVKKQLDMILISSVPLYLTIFLPLAFVCSRLCLCLSLRPSVSLSHADTL